MPWRIWAPRPNTLLDIVGIGDTARKPMAKSKHRTRDASHIASSTALGEKYSHLKNPYNITPAAVQYREALGLDRRLYRPDKSTRPPTHRSPLAARVTLQVIKVRQRRRQFHAKLDKYTNPFHKPKTYLRTRLGFSLPRRIEACIRRSVRKEVIHAKRHAGKGGQKKPIRNFWSAISCRKR